MVSQMLRHCQQALLIFALTLAAQQVHCQDDASATATPKTLAVSGLQAAIKAADGTSVVSNKGSYPAVLFTSPQISAQHSLEVTATIKANGDEFKPQQAFLAVTHKATGMSAYAVGKAKKGVYIFSLPASSIEKQLGKQAGDYDVVLMLGDPSVTTGVKWSLGSVELLVPAADAVPAQRTTRTQPVSNALPIIQHIFRQPDKRPPAIISLLFTGLVMLPLVAVIVYVLSALNINFNAWPRDAFASLMALAFHGLLAAMLALYLFFWLQWDLAHTLPAALALGVPLALTGHYALASLATARLGAKKD